MKEHLFTTICLAVPALLWFLPFSALPATPNPKPSPQELQKTGDAHYTRRDYQTAHLFYRYLYSSWPDDDTGSRLLLSSLRLNDDETLLKMLYRPLPNGGFTYSYLAIFAAYRLQRYDLASLPLKRLEYRPPEDLTETQRNRLQFLRGAEIIDRRRFQEAILFYSELGKNDDATGIRSRRLVEDLKQHTRIARKVPWLAAGMSALLPGAGQAYTEHYSDATLAFFWNLTFLGGSTYLYSLERAADRPHTGSIVAGLVGLAFYASNVLGAYSSAHRRNVYVERRFAEHLRRSYFSTDYIERSSEIEFHRPLEQEPASPPR